MKVHLVFMLKMWRQASRLQATVKNFTYFHSYNHTKELWHPKKIFHLKPFENPILLCKHLAKPCQDIRKCHSAHKNYNNTHRMTIIEKLVAKTPPDLQPYLRLMRLDKPTGTMLLLWPCCWSLAMATPPGCLPSLYLLALFGSGAVLMRSAGCIINDLWDKDIDAKVERTKSRPLASGDVSVLNAWMLLGGQLSLALLVLLQMNWHSILIGASSLLFVISYPLVKRFSHWPQLMLGLTFNWGVILAGSEVHGVCQWSTILPLYAACVSWTMIYDTIYAHQDKVDDVLIKIKSTAIKFGDKTKHWLSGFSTSMVSCLLLSGYITQQTLPFYTSVGITAAALAYQITALNIDDPQNCWKMFKSNQRIGWIIFLGIVTGTLFKEQKEIKFQKSSLLTKDMLLPSSDISMNKMLPC